MDTARYPFELVESVVLRDGRRILLRPIHPQDERLTQAFVRSLSPRSRYQRFHYALQELPPELLRRATRVDYHRHLALIAETFDGGVETEIGAARYVARAGTTVGEFALVVADAWQGQGLGRLLLGKLIPAAREHGLTRLEGEVLHDNRAMLGVARALGFKARKHPEEAGLLVVARDLASTGDARWLPAMHGIAPPANPEPVAA